MAKPVADPASDPTITPLQLCKKQIEAMKLCREKSYNLLSGPRRSAKTMGGLACECDHAWTVPHAEIALVAISQSAGLGSGVWDQLVDGILPKYMKLGQGMKWVREPFTAQSSKRPTCVVSNQHGGTCRFQLESLKDESEVEVRFKNKFYTSMFVTELSHYRQAKTFSIWKQALRSIHGVRPEQFLFLGDTNPSDEGDESWIYHQWFVRPRQTYAEYCEFQAERGLPMSSEEDFRLVNERIGLLEFEIDDNWFLTNQEIRELVDTYSHDQDLYDRYILGKWVKASEGALFSQQWRDSVHAVGEVETPGNRDPVILYPSDASWKLYVTIDPGSSANSVGHIFDKRLCQPTPNGPVLPYFYILDEVAIIGEDHTLDEFTARICQAMFDWEQRTGRLFEWVYWSDRSVFEQRDNASKKYYHQLIFEASAKWWKQKFDETKIPHYATRVIALQAADRSKGSVEQRVDLARKLLFEERMRISRGRCPKLVQAFKSLPPAKNNANVPAKGHAAKHPFDSVMYGISEECYDEITSAMMRTLRNQRGSSVSGLVSVGI